MTDITLLLTARTHRGNDIRKLRKTGAIPVVIYNIETNIVAQCYKNEFIKVYRLLKEADDMSLTVSLDGAPMAVSIKAIDVNPVTNEPRHVDFYLTK